MYQSRLESTREFRYSVWVKAFCKNNERCSLSSLLHTLILHLSLRPPVLINIAPPPSLLRGYPSVRPSIHPISSIRPTTAENKTRRETKKRKKTTSTPPYCPATFVVVVVVVVVNVVVVELISLPPPLSLLSAPIFSIRSSPPSRSPSFAAAAAVAAVYANSAPRRGPEAKL
ncbi:hypothetical protein IWX47DRAFT_598977 [Phyllosticta citricarpa]